MLISNSLSVYLPSIHGKALDSNYLSNQFLVIKAYKLTQSYMLPFVPIDNFLPPRVFRENIDENFVHVNKSLNLLYELAREEVEISSHGEESDQI